MSTYSECRASANTDDGGDATAVDCSDAAAMPIAMACSQSQAGDKTFCAGACASQLGPYYEECQSLMPGYISMMLAPQISMLTGCAGFDTDDAGDVCDLMGLMTICTAPGAGMDALDMADMTAVCANPCITSMFPCAGNPMLAMTLGADTADGIPALEAMCGDSVAAAAGPGDGVCDMVSLMSMLQDGSLDACECIRKCIFSLHPWIFSQTPCAFIIYMYR